MIPLPRQRRRKVYGRLVRVDHELTEVTSQGSLNVVFDQHRHVHVGYSSTCLKSECRSITHDSSELGDYSSTTVEALRFDSSPASVLTSGFVPGQITMASANRGYKCGLR